MNRGVWAAVLAVVLWRSAVHAQQINGLAAWTVGSGTNTYDSQSYKNTALSQHYVLGVDSPFFDARFLKLNAEGSFRTNALTSGASGEGRRGDQRAVGYRLGGAMFPLRPFPLTVQASRDVIDESADYPTSSAIRGGIAIPAGSVAPTFLTTARTLAANWQLNTQQLPKVELGYTTSDFTTAGSAYEAAQRNEDLHANVVKESSRLRNSFRYNRNVVDNLQSSAYNQRNSDLDYEFGAVLGTRSRMNVHTGQRRTFSLFDLPTAIVDPAAGTYAVPLRGDSNVRYVISSLSFEPVPRFSVDTTGSIDRQEADPVATGSRLVFVSTHLDAGGGLSLNATGTYGDREQIIADRAVSVVTQSGQAGAAFRTGPRWLEGSVGYNQGVGLNRTPDGVRGTTAIWSGQATLSSAIRWFAISAGEDRTTARDDILDYGNAQVVRDRASLNVQQGRLTISGSWEDAVVDRGRDATFVRLLQRSATGSASLRVTGTWVVGANAGTFTNVGPSGTDTTQFWGGIVNVEPSRGLRLSASARQEAATATQTGLVQNSLFWLGLVEYQLRDFTLSLEYRNGDQDLRSAPLVDRYRFKGQQMLLRIARKLVIPL